MKKRLLSLLAMSVACLAAQAQINITSVGTPYTQNFDQMPSGPLNTFHIMPLSGWGIWEKSTNANDSIRINAGASNAGDTYNFGTDLITDRALGSIASGSNLPSFGCQFQNATGAAIGGINMAFVTEMWRNGDTLVGNLDTSLFEYSLNATGLGDTVATWTTVSVLNLLTPNTTLIATGALDGNLTGNRANVSGSFNLNLANGAKIWIRWRDINKVQGDDGLAVDDLTVTFIPLNNDKPIISSLSPADGTANVPVATNAISATFDRPISVGATGLCLVLNITDGTSQMITNAQTTASGNIATFTGVNLLANKEYSVLFDSTIIVSVVAPNTFNCYGIYDNTSWNFNTNWATSVSDVSTALQNMQVYANSSSLRIQFDAHTAGQTRFEVVAVNGQTLSVLNQDIRSGSNAIEMPINTLANGLYYVRCVMGQNRVAKPFVKK